MSDYFSFSVEDNEFVIRERTSAFEFGGKDKRGYSAYDKKTAWSAARSQTLPVRVIKLDGSEQMIGIAFDPRSFERIAYSGYVSHGVSTTDGYYAPLKFEQWVKSFRDNPSQEMISNDAPQYVKDSLPAYVEALAAVTR